MFGWRLRVWSQSLDRDVNLTSIIDLLKGKCYVQWDLIQTNEYKYCYGKEFMSKADISINPYGRTWESRREKRTFINSIEWMTCTHCTQKEIIFYGGDKYYSYMVISRYVSSIKLNTFIVDLIVSFILNTK